jgi:uncharacterized protein
MEFSPGCAKSAMEIIIDGYNLIGRDQGLSGALEHKRNWLLQQLSRFREKKDFEVTIVFDGWRSGSRYEVEEKKAGVRIVFSRLGEKADSVIIRIARAKGSGCVVVTSDREIRNAVEKFGAISLRSGEFAEILASIDVPRYGAEEYDPEPDSRKTGNPRRLSKADRRRFEILRKLRS